MSAATDEPITGTTEALNGLLQTAQAAVETYTHAIGLFDDAMVIGELQKIRDDHRRAERELRELVVRLNGLPANGSGLWVALSAAGALGTKALGCATLLAALRQGEEHALGAYEEALGHEDIHPDCHRLIGGDLLPASRKHIDELNRLLGGTC
ncbi:MAG TPA: DUF2383 domain-containing protein [Gemmata sp.]